VLARIITNDGAVAITLAQAEDEEEHLEETDEAEHEGVEAPNPIFPATNEIIWGAGSFFVLLVVLWRFLLPAIQQGMENRTNRIRENLDEAERTKSEAQRVLEDYQRQLADARNESARIIEETRQTAEQMRRDLMSRAEAEVKELRERTSAEIAAARERALAELETDVSEMAIQLAEKVIEANLDRDTQLRLIESYISQVGSSR
jgi:F-type H+-transporting ATPase subunit b